ncbi:MAG: hypothetical protein DBX55_01935 [Verrucomicrobia bacterium]|nr:MAG: hypothetical protein DBX55_01935 [Verrucomicrobiota bacterium]
MNAAGLPLPSEIFAAFESGFANRRLKCRVWHASLTAEYRERYIYGVARFFEVFNASTLVSGYNPTLKPASGRIARVLDAHNE